MASATRTLSRYDLLQEGHYTPRLQHSARLELTPPETVTEERTRAAQTWQALQADPEQMLNDRVELEQRDRALLAARKQVFAARAEVDAVSGEVQAARHERFRNPMVYSLGALAAVSFAGWIFQRRQLLALREAEGHLAMPLPILANPAAFPPAVEPGGTSGFEESDMEVMEDEAAQWIERARVAVPSTR